MTQFATLQHSSYWSVRVLHMLPALSMNLVQPNASALSVRLLKCYFEAWRACSALKLTVIN